MIFNALNESNERGEFYGAMCHWHLRKDGQLTIREILIEQGEQGRGQGAAFIERLKRVPGAVSIFANCPASLPANGFYEHLGFFLESETPTKSGTLMKQWRLCL